MNEVIKINTSKIENIFNIDEFILENNYTLEKALIVILSNILTNESIKEGEIGMNDNDFYIGLEIINRINENKNIILKFFDFFQKGLFYEDYFSIENPDYEKFINDIQIDDISYQNKLIIIPLNISYHFSLFLIYNKKIYFLDFGLLLVVDNISVEFQRKLNYYDDEICNYLSDKNYDSEDIWSIIDNNDNNSTIFEKLKSIIKECDQTEFFTLVKLYKSEHSKLNNNKY